MGKTDNPIVVAGGGVGGLSAALMLAKAGWQVIVLELLPSFRETGAGIQIGPNAFQMFEQMGITKAIEDLAVFPEALTMMDALTAEQITRVPVNTEHFFERFGHRYGVIYRRDLHSVILRACLAQEGVELRSGQPITGYEDKGDHVVVKLEDEEIAAHALIGADGLWSIVRNNLFGEQKPRVSGHIAYRAVLEAANVPPENQSDDVMLWAGPRTHLVHYPLHRGSLYNLVAVFHSDRYEEGWNAYGDPDELHKKFGRQTDAVMGMLDQIETWRMWVLCDRDPISTWSKGRVTLLGDAAHPTMQYLAQGACMALEDSVCLATMMTRNDGDPIKAFKDYEQARYLRTGRVQLTSRLYGDIYHAENVARELRAMMLGPRTPDVAYNGMEWLYNGVNDDGSQKL